MPDEYRKVLSAARGAENKELPEKESALCGLGAAAPCMGRNGNV